MKLSIFALTAILTSLAAANPILTPRAPSPSFKLYGDVGDVNLGLLTIIPITEPNKPVYYGFGWYGQGAQPIELFLQEESKRGRVLDLRQNGYEMIFQAVPDPNGNPVSCYRPLLINRANTPVVGLESTSQFWLYVGHQLYSGDGNPDNADGWNWMNCLRSETTDQANLKYVEELYFCDGFLPSGCDMGRGPVRLSADFASSAAVTLVAAVDVSG